MSDDVLLSLKDAVTSSGSPPPVVHPTSLPPRPAFSRVGSRCTPHDSSPVNDIVGSSYSDDPRIIGAQTSSPRRGARRTNNSSRSDKNRSRSSSPRRRDASSTSLPPRPPPGRRPGYSFSRPKLPRNPIMFDDCYTSAAIIAEDYGDNATIAYHDLVAHQNSKDQSGLLPPGPSRMDTLVISDQSSPLPVPLRRFSQPAFHDGDPWATFDPRRLFKATAPSAIAQLPVGKDEFIALFESAVLHPYECRSNCMRHVVNLGLQRRLQGANGDSAWASLEHNIHDTVLNNPKAIPRQVRRRYQFGKELTFNGSDGEHRLVPRVYIDWSVRDLGIYMAVRSSQPLNLSVVYTWPALVHNALRYARQSRDTGDLPLLDYTPRRARQDSGQFLGNPFNELEVLYHFSKYGWTRNRICAKDETADIWSYFERSFAVHGSRSRCTVTAAFDPEQHDELNFESNRTCPMAVNEPILRTPLRESKRAAKRTGS
ncbi:hypothetical protein BKA62DRAFT_705696 [Auriculariales sp. MPI-PUGE-AT-0066]|nr:hypothetical protein BKA62DRAFT_705696 [Auriculariales sp. MPI-PUGE-AT-0066]